MSSVARSRILIGAVLCSIAAAACAAVRDVAPAGSTTTIETDGTNVADRAGRPGGLLPDQIPATSDRQTASGEVPEEQLENVVLDAALRAGIDVDEVVLVTAQAMVWSDGSLGCPERGEVYTQAPVPGYWVVVEAAESAFDYRLTERGTVRLCTNPFGAPPGSGPPES